ncbi:MAG: UDP-N-acetylglucosamine 1-carboxyvinyltransferase [Eubacteriales bacterium]|nr:UDP-N-acetylglucosamine 1-carboxyvinyltransferase [Eubacteriales bacterium]
MEKLIVKGQKKLSGEVFISGAKNAVVAIIPAAIIAEGISIIENLPCIEDVTCFIKTLRSLGIKCELLSENKLKIDSTKIESAMAVNDDVRKMRASYYLMGALIGRFKKVSVALPGGCNFGSRPIDQHIRGFKALGVKIKENGDTIELDGTTLKGANIYLDMVSVGATINIMLAAVLADGITTIENAAKEPHVVDTANFLNMLGAKITGAGTDVIKITGVKKLHGGEYTIIPDQIEAGTYMIAAAISGGDICVRNIIPKHMDSLSAKLLEMGCEIEEGDDYIRVKSNERLKGTNVKTMAYPGFPTDLQPQMTTLLAYANGTSSLTENVWENRFQYIKELEKMGAKITLDGRVATINGVSKFTGAEVSATDLRAGAAMILAGLVAEGETIIGNIKYIDRGYEKVEEKFRALGADITRIK